MRTFKFASAVALLSLVVLVPGARADQTIATVTQATPVSAFGGRVVWSSYQPGRGFVLMTYLAGTVSEVPVAPRPAPFDADVGPASNGGATVVYSRCRHEPAVRHGFPGNALTVLPEWQTGRGCDLYRFDFDRGRETRIAGASTRRASEFLPSVWKGRITFARVFGDRRGRAGKLSYLYSRPLSKTGHSRRLPAGARSTARFCTGKPLHCRHVVERGPTSLDLGESRLAFGWDSATGDGATSSVYLDRLGSHPTRRRVARVGSGQIQADELIGPTLDAGHVWWADTLFGDETENRLQRFGLTTRTIETTVFAARDPLSPFIRSVLANAVAGSAGYYLLSGPGIGLPEEPCTPATPCISTPGCTDAAPCEVRAASLPAFTKPS